MDKDFNIKKMAEKCIHCNKCRNVCDFLEKYKIDLQGFSKREDLKYHCFLCNECTKVCPVGIDGTKLSLAMRLKETKGSTLKEKGYSMILLEKKKYVFRNWTKGNYMTLIYPGCNFTSLYPKTVDYLNGLAKAHGMGMANECCGKPIYELGLENKSMEILNELDINLKVHGVKEIICLCPNCYHYFLKTKIAKKYSVKMIYEVLEDWERKFDIKLRKGKEAKNKELFIPCPDKIPRTILDMIEKFIPKIGENIVDDVQCCGLGGLAFKKEKDIVNNLKEKIKEHGEILTYCATCTGQFNKIKGVKSHHVLSHILKTDEYSDTKGSLLNRAVRRY